jgi:hypothetical protein
VNEAAEAADTAAWAELGRYLHARSRAGGHLPAGGREAHRQVKAAAEARAQRFGEIYWGLLDRIALDHFQEWSGPEVATEAEVTSARSAAAAAGWTTYDAWLGDLDEGQDVLALVARPPAGWADDLDAPEKIIAGYWWGASQPDAGAIPDPRLLPIAKRPTA